jgi:DNA-binding MarR family transcriptional regulator
VDLTMAQFKAVLLLAASGGLPSRVLGSRLGIRPSAVTPLVDRLVAGRFVKRESDPADRRVVYVKPSRKAIDLAQRLMETNRAVVAEVIEAIPARDRAEGHWRPPRGRHAGAR